MVFLLKCELVPFGKAREARPHASARSSLPVCVRVAHNARGVYIATHLVHISHSSFVPLSPEPRPRSPLQKLVSVATVNVNCGSGEQLVRWLGFVACSQLSELLGETPGRYVPQAVMLDDGSLVDADHVRARPRAAACRALTAHSC